MGSSFGFDFYGLRNYWVDFSENFTVCFCKPGIGFQTGFKSMGSLVLVPDLSSLDSETKGPITLNISQLVFLLWYRFMKRSEEHTSELQSQL